MHFNVKTQLVFHRLSLNMGVCRLYCVYEVGLEWPQFRIEYCTVFDIMNCRRMASHRLEVGRTDNLPGSVAKAITNHLFLVN